LTWGKGKGEKEKRSLLWPKGRGEGKEGTRHLPFLIGGRERREWTFPKRRGDRFEKGKKKKRGGHLQKDVRFWSGGGRGRKNFVIVSS